jgi:predicted permease
MSTLRRVLRSLARSPGFTAVTVATLALGIGANAAVFSVVDAVLLRPLPYPESDRIVLLSGAGQAFVRFRADIGFDVSPEELRESRAFASIGIAESGGLNLGAERPVRVRAARVTPDFFRVLDVKPILGTAFTDGDLDDSPRLVVLGHRLWQSRFGADPAIIGQTIRLNDVSVLITGVMPPRVEFPERSEVWVSARGSWQLEGSAAMPTVVARLSPDTSIAQALDELIRIDDEWGTRGGRPDRRLIPLREALVGHVRPVLSLIAWSAVFVLLVACINVTNLLLTRIAARERDFSVRRVLGASRWRLARHALSEGLLLSIAASCLALPVAIWTLDGIRTFVPQALHGASEIAMNARALASLSGLSIATAVLVGLLPSLSLSERVSSHTRGTFAATVGPSERRIRSALVVAEVAIALVLLASSVTLVGTLAALMKTDLGARGDNALVVELTLPRATYRSPERVWRFYESFIAELLGIPGVAAVGVTDQLPGNPTKAPLATGIELDGSDATEPSSFAIASCASPGYFEALGIDLLAGRAFTSGDRPGSPPVAIVSEGFVRALSLQPSEIIGRHTNLAGMMDPRESREVVGVVRDVRYRGPQESFSASVYKPCSEQPPFASGRVVVKAGFDAETLVPAVRRAAAELDPGLPLHNVRSFEEIRAESLAEERLAMTFLSAFGALAFALAILGLYGIISYLVQLRTREIGIRLAFGASPSRIKRDVLATGLSHAATGAIIGVASTLALSRLAWTRIAGLEQIDFVNLLLLVVAVGGVATFASWFPARRATRVDPVQSLRFE